MIDYLNGPEMEQLINTLHMVILTPVGIFFVGVMLYELSKRVKCWIG